MGLRRDSVFGAAAPLFNSNTIGTPGALASSSREQVHRTVGCCFDCSSIVGEESRYHSGPGKGEKLENRLLGPTNAFRILFACAALRFAPMRANTGFFDTSTKRFRAGLVLGKWLISEDDRWKRTC